MAMEKAASFLSSLIGGGGGGEPAATVKSILIYPIKSCRGIAVAQAPITATAIMHQKKFITAPGMDPLKSSCRGTRTIDDVSVGSGLALRMMKTEAAEWFSAYFEAKPTCSLQAGTDLNVISLE
ncbi:hypothetical protein HU200_011143 [Digitaria exilis]|uniref:Molybdenum cofactor sulfurase n=1 Tax=Digitaria exilis TaxID=1010633 RepID=A0A835FIE9_9POAL|nr:hypothetical protein HU200_011143 [Digitaria exilis]